MAEQTTPEIVFYLARADNGVIGEEGALPWHIPADWRRFKRMTMGKPMIMGRVTIESFNAPLPGRRNIVLTRNRDWAMEGAEVVHDPEEALALAGDVPEIAVIGGAEIFALYRDRARRVEITEVHCAPPEGPSVPAFLPDEWRETFREEHPAADGQPAYDFVTLVRREVRRRHPAGSRWREATCPAPARTGRRPGRLPDLPRPPVRRR